MLSHARHGARGRPSLATRDYGESPQALVKVVQLPLKPGDVSLDAGTDGDGGSGLRRFFSETSMVITWCLRAAMELRTWVSVAQRAHGRSDCFGEVSQYRRVQSVGLGQLPSGSGEVPHLAGVDDDHRHRLGCQGCDYHFYFS